MNKQALLENVYNSAFNDELEKVSSDEKRTGILRSAWEDFKATDVPSLTYGVPAAVGGGLISKLIPRSSMIGNALGFPGMFGHVGLGALQDKNPSRWLMRKGIGPKTLGAAIIAGTLASLYGGLKGGQKLLKEKTGKDISKKRALAIGAEKAVVETGVGLGGRVTGGVLGNIVESITGLPVTGIASDAGDVAGSIFGKGYASRRALENKGFVKIKGKNE